MFFLACAAPESTENPAPAHDGAGVDSGESIDLGESGDPGETGDSGGGGPAGVRGLLVAQSWDDRAWPTGAGAGEYRVIFLQESMYPLLPEIRAANPEARVFAYQKVGGMRSDGDDHPSTGVRADLAEESWFLHDAAGERLVYCDHPEVWAAEVGNPGYQAAWTAAVLARVTADGFDGVMLDDVNTFPGHCLGDQGTPIAEYPTDEAYGEATVAFMAAVGPALQAEGLAVAPNIALNPWDTTQLVQAAEMLPYVTHWVREYWMRWDVSANFLGDEWEATLDTMLLAQEADVGYLAITYGPGVEGASSGQRYGRASWLLAWDGESDSAWGYWGAGEDPWSEEWAQDLGRPVAPIDRQNGAWVREYSAGWVAVNPNPFPVDLTFEDDQALHLEPGEGTWWTE